MDNDLSKVIERTDLIENLLNQIIYNYSSPRDEARLFFWYILLDTTVIHLGAKIKVVKTIAKELPTYNSKKYGSSNRVIEYRNAFAHHGLQSHPTNAVGKASAKDEHKFMLHFFQGSGNLKKISREKALKNFNKHFEIEKKQLVQLNESIKN